MIFLDELPGSLGRIARSHLLELGLDGCDQAFAMVEDGFVWTWGQSRIDPLDRLLREGVHDGSGSETCDAVVVEPHGAVWVASPARSAELTNNSPRSLVGAARDSGARGQHRDDTAGHVSSLSSVKIMGLEAPSLIHNHRCCRFRRAAYCAARC